MRIDVISFTARGAETARTVKQELVNQEMEVACWTMRAGLAAEMGQPVSEGLTDWTATAFRQADAILFVGATGIAVRAIAPYVQSKETDPAVIVVDELGIHAISLLSGHIGGANELTRQIAGILAARPVITTATDINGLFAVDQWAAERQMTISDMKLAKEVAARQLAGSLVGFYSEVPVRGTLPKGLVLCGGDGKPLPAEAGGETAAGATVASVSGVKAGSAGCTVPPSLGIAVTWRQDCRPFPDTLQLIPQIVTLGMGCRKEIPGEKVENLLRETLAATGVAGAALEKVASIDLKAEEAALLAAAKDRGIPFQVFAAAELAAVAGEFSPSRFVQSVTGVDNVCERAAILGSNGGTLILQKLAKDGVTAALAIRNIELTF